MRLVSALLFIALTGSTTLADEAKPADPKPEVAKGKVPLRVVRMLPETRQVLLLHKNRGTHVVAEVGQDVDGFIVDEIDGDEVTLVAPNGAEVILTAPDMTWRRRAAERKAAAAKHAAKDAAAKDAAAPETTATKDAAPEDPYADEAPAGSTSTVPAGEVRVASAGGVAPTSTPAPAGTPVPTGTAAPTGMAAPTGTAATTGMAAPTGTAATTTPAPTTSPAPTTTPAAPGAIVDAGWPPADPYADAAIAAFAEAVGATPPPAAPQPAPAAAKPATGSHDAAGALAAAATGTPAPTSPAPTTSIPAAAAPGAASSFTLARADVDAALADFGATAVTFDAKFVAEGLRIDSIADGTILAKAGLRKGDTITAIDGKPLRSFDDAADLYARMPTARATTIIVQRAGKPVTLKIAIR